MLGAERRRAGEEWCGGPSGHPFPAVLELKPQARTCTWLTKVPQGWDLSCASRMQLVSATRVSVSFWPHCWDTGKPNELLMP